LDDAAAQFLSGGANPVDRADDVLDQLLYIIGATIGEDTFRERPNTFIGVQFRSIGGKVLDVQPGMLLQKLSQGLPLMGGRIIQQDNHRAAHMTQQLAEKEADLSCAILSK
jgi:hypothetical protein